VVQEHTEKNGKCLHITPYMIFSGVVFIAIAVVNSITRAGFIPKTREIRYFLARGELRSRHFPAKEIISQVLYTRYSFLTPEKNHNTKSRATPSLSCDEKVSGKVFIPGATYSTCRMKVAVRFFARCREIVGEHRKELEVAPGTRITDLIVLLKDVYPGLKNEQLRAAVNHCYADPTALLHEQDEVAIFPPVSGG
jgi:molybdopterin synthase sulfur carrier subunit